MSESGDTEKSLITRPLPFLGGVSTLQKYSSLYWILCLLHPKPGSISTSLGHRGIRKLKEAGVQTRASI